MKPAAARWIAALGAFPLFALACERAQQGPSGRVAYERHCAACHGLDGKGDGPVAASLQTKPTDLTRIAAEAGGRFDERRVWAVIDGRTGVTAHGPREMPVWGAVFLSELADQPYPRYTTFLRVRNLSDYLSSIQE